jgi:hypothetical protein
MNFSWKSDLLGDATINLPISKYTEHFFRNMIGDKKTLKEIQESISKDMGKKVTDSEFMNEVNKIMPIFEDSGALLLRKKKVDFAPMMG